MATKGDHGYRNPDWCLKLPSCLPWLLANMADIPLFKVKGTLTEEVGLEHTDIE